VLQFGPLFHWHEFVPLSFEQHHGDGHVVTLSIVDVNFSVEIVGAGDLFQQQQDSAVFLELAAGVFFVGILCCAAFSL
jgi:hypothetical protein